MHSIKRSAHTLGTSLSVYLLLPLRYRTDIDAYVVQSLAHSLRVESVLDCNFGGLSSKQRAWATVRSRRRATT